MFIEKYQPYTSLAITYNGEEINENNPITLPATVNGEYKVNLDAIGVDDNGKREDLPFTRNDITWWFVDPKKSVLTKEINVGDNAGSKITIDDSGTFSINSIEMIVPENRYIEVVCVLGVPNSLKLSEFDIQTFPIGHIKLRFGSGGGGEIDWSEYCGYITIANNMDVGNTIFMSTTSCGEDVLQEPYILGKKNIRSGQRYSYYYLYETPIIFTLDGNTIINENKIITLEPSNENISIAIRQTFTMLQSGYTVECPIFTVTGSNGYVNVSLSTANAED